MGVVTTDMLGAESGGSTPRTFQRITMRLRAVAFLWILCPAVVFAAQPVRIVGQVRSVRSGAGVAGCQVDFVANNQLAHRVYTDQGGNFVVDAASQGQYTVWVYQGGRSQEFRVTVYNGGLQPSVLEVPW